MKENKVVLIGCGNVGLSFAYSLVNQKTSVNSLYIIDINEKRVKGEVMDLNHTLAFSPSKIDIFAGKYSDCADADVIVLCAGAAQAPGETRVDLASRNASIFKGILDEVLKTGFNGIFVIATNPVDTMSYLTMKYTGFAPNKVIGSGTSLDSMRLKYMIGKKVKINPKSINAYVLGEHGDSEFIPWDNANIALQPIDKFLSDNDKKVIEDKVKNSAYEIINLKGNTSYGIGITLARIVNAILDDEKEIFVLSVYDKKHNVYIGQPAVLSKDGIFKKIKFKLNDEDAKKYINSVNAIKKVQNLVVN